MAIILHLRPVGDTRVLDPGVNPPCPLPPEGKAVEDAPFWRRRMKAKEVEQTTPELIAAGKAAREAREEETPAPPEQAAPEGASGPVSGPISGPISGKTNKPGKE